jgi:hypothetical protein
MQLNYDSVKPILIKGKWYKNNASGWRQSTTLMQDECGIQRVLAREFLRDELVTHESFVFPEQCNQMFLVPDRLHEDWQLVVDMEVRRTRPSIPRPLEDVIMSPPGSPASEPKEREEDATADSNSDGERETSNRGDNADDEVYPEEILTYKRRPRQIQPTVLECHTVEESVEEDILSDEDNALEL